MRKRDGTVDASPHFSRRSSMSSEGRRVTENRGGSRVADLVRARDERPVLLLADGEFRLEVAAVQ
ncbi:hypothetical protein NJ7G_3009 [Natrinema sp. J7-2]|nr:hypothetical protein NJ7G_3009 [Natrinema sp. J7-2]